MVIPLAKALRLLLCAAVVLAILPALNTSSGTPPDRGETRAGEGPIVNQTVMKKTFLENFGYPENEIGSIEGERVINLSRVFYDPHYTISQYLVDYPPEFTERNAPILCDIINSPGPRFGYVSLYTSPGGVNFNSKVYQWYYGKSRYNLTITAVNATGTSSAILSLYIEDINDPPIINESYSFYEARIMEDNISESYDLTKLFYDKYDPWDTQYLTFSYKFRDENYSRYIDITILENGIIRIVPARDWNGFTKVLFTATDPGALSVSKELIITVVGVNDPPVFPPVPDLYLNEGDRCEIHFNASDPADGDTITYSTNILNVITPLNFGYNYSFHRYFGILSFDTDNELVGVYPIWVRADDGNGSYVQRDFTIYILNVNQPPVGRIVSPGDGDTYGSLDNITLRGVVTDPDIIHNDTHNFTWYLDNDTILGYGPRLNVTISDPGYHNITLVVTDSGGLESTDRVRIRILKSVVYGEKFIGKDLNQHYTDPSGDVYSFYRGAETKEVKGEKENIDLIELTGVSKGQTFEITVVFAGDLSYVNTISKKDEPYLWIFFVKPGHQEEPLPVGSHSTRPTFYSPIGETYYSGLTVDLYSNTFSALPLSNIAPSLTISGRTVKITITYRELDMMGVEPDFRLFVTGELRESITSEEGNIIISSYDSIGEGAIPPPEPPSGNHKPGGDNEGKFPIVAVVGGVVAVVVVILLLVLVILPKRRKKVPEVAPTPVPETPPEGPVVDFSAIPGPSPTEVPQPPQPEGYTSPPQVVSEEKEGVGGGV